MRVRARQEETVDPDLSGLLPAIRIDGLVIARPESIDDEAAINLHTKLNGARPPSSFDDVEVAWQIPREAPIPRNLLQRFCNDCGKDETLKFFQREGPAAICEGVSPK